MDDRRRYHDNASPGRGMMGMDRDRSPNLDLMRSGSPAARLGGKFPPPPPPPPKEGDTSSPPGVKKPEIYKTLDPLSSKSSPLIGLHHMYEHQTTGQPPRYECRLCKALIKDSTIFLKHVNGEHHKRKFIEEFYMNYAFTMKMCNNKKDQKEMMDGFVMQIDMEEGKKYVNLIRDGEEIDWAKTLKEGEETADSRGGKDAVDDALEEGEDIDDPDRKSSTNALVDDAADAKVSSTSELDKRDDDASRAEVEEMLQRVVNTKILSGVGGGDNNQSTMKDGFDRGGSLNSRNSTHPSDITSSDQLQQEINNGNLFNGNQHSQPNRQKPPLPPPPPPPPEQHQQNGDNPLKNILQKKLMKVLPVPPPHPPPPPPPPNTDRSIDSSPYPPPKAEGTSRPSSSQPLLPPPAPVPPPVAQPLMAPLEVLQAMTVMVTSEEEARMALQVAQALTQAVYRYRQHQFHLSHSANGRP